MFGPLIAFGLGGIYVEVMGDVRFGVTPLSDQDAKELIAGIRGYSLLKGFRGKPPADIEALEETLCGFPGWWKRYRRLSTWT